ncbi:MAG: invasion associated locus B family protein [Rhizobiales bacterium]|nr:invasion associated locus B family protein [Hyphomicrobiales bacterium]MBN9009771.1 invasion associated locus B family protein [Hyphomicrobiales bacterium]
MGNFGATQLKGRAVLAAATVTMSLALAVPALAQAAQPTPPAKPAAPAADAGGGAAAPAAGGQPTWVKLCNTDAASKKELCLTLQELRAETGQFIASATLRQVTGDDKVSFIAAVPPGMLLQPGLRVQVDGGKQYPIKYGICFQNACYGELDIDSDLMSQMRKGKQLVLTTLNQQAKGVSFPMTLAGFSKAYDGKGLDAAGQAARQDDLNKALQARAEQARKKLIEQQQKEGGDAAPQQ